MRKLESAIYSSKKKSSPNLDSFDYNIIRYIPSDLLTILLGIYNDLHAQGIFPNSWNLSLIIFVPKSSRKDVRPIALFSCILKLFERKLYRSMQWAVETRFLLSNFQSRFRNFHSCTDNLVTLNNCIHSFLITLPFLQFSWTLLVHSIMSSKLNLWFTQSWLSCFLL